MSNCTNCNAELAPGEIDLCYPCTKASPLEKFKRKESASSKPTKPVKQPHINVLILPSSPERKLLLGLSSGQQLTACKLMLYPESDIRQYLTLKAKAQEELSGFSTGIGFWGSPEWAIGGAAAMGFIESMVANSKAEKGLKILNEATSRQNQMRGKGLFFDIGAISGIWQPNPTAWNITQTSEYPDDLPEIFIHSGDEFIWVEADGQHIAVRWESVVSYHLI